MVEMGEETKKQLLKVLSNVEASLPRVREAIEKGELTRSSQKTFHTRYLGRLPNGEILESAIIIMGSSATFSFIGVP